MLRQDGSVFFADILGNTLTYGGRPCVLGLYRDITERTQAQAALERERQTLKHLLQSSDHERQLIAYEIHDGLAQLLAAASMQFEAYAHLKDEKPSEAAEAYDAALSLLRRSHAESRRLISGVRPLVLDEAGIVAAVTHLVDAQRRENGPAIEFHHQVQFERLVPILENAIYRIVQEGLANACRHGNSQRIRVELLQHDGNLRIKIQDWGIGFNPEEVGEGRFGLAGMRERARLLGGSISVESRPRKGTCITVELPLMTRE
jgi:signal transduction histidine kinase